MSDNKETSEKMPQEVTKNFVEASNEEFEQLSKAEIEQQINEKYNADIKTDLKTLLRTPLIITYIIVAVIAIMYVIRPYKRVEFNVKDKSCFGNQRVILGAIEMHNMDTSPMIDKYDDEVLQTLLKGGYLKSAPALPDPRCKYIGYNLLENEGTFYCEYHGNISEYKLPNGQPSPYRIETERKENLPKYLAGGFAIALIAVSVWVFL